MALDDPPDLDEDLAGLRERAKELACVYRVAAALDMRDEPPPSVFARVLEALPSGWQYPEVTGARIEYLGRTYASAGYRDTPWRQCSPIRIRRAAVGTVEVVYTADKPAAWEGPFLREERQLIDHVARRVGEYLEWKHRALEGERIDAPLEYWRWRQRFAERIAASIDPERFGVERVYLHGSTEAGSAGVGSDIDLLVVFHGDELQRRELAAWLEGWSTCLGELAFQFYGHRSTGLLDVRLVAPDRIGAELSAKARSGESARELPLVHRNPAGGEEPAQDDLGAPSSAWQAPRGRWNR